MSFIVFEFLALTILHMTDQAFSVDDCMERNSNELTFTKPGFSLKAGYVKKRLQTTSLIQCSLRCVQEDWCVSVHFEVSKSPGICELNDHGVERNGDLLNNSFEERKGFVYSQLRFVKFTCREDFCSNGGTCKINCQTSKAQCLCPEGYQGATCQDINECSSNPCRNGATCTDQVNGYSCTCPTGYSGTRCENNINECSSNPCQNGGTCTDQVNGYSCTCPAGYSGARCENNIDECSSNPCQNGGTCTDQVNGYSCTCPAGYSGTRCENNIDDCSSNPCLNGGVCSDRVNDYFCSCPDDYVGKNCQTDDD